MLLRYRRLLVRTARMTLAMEELPNDVEALKRIIVEQQQALGRTLRLWPCLEW